MARRRSRQASPVLGLAVAIIASLAAAEVRSEPAPSEPPSGARGAAARSAPTEVRSVDGLDRPAQILIDRWGIPHIYARSQRDAFFVQGYNAARDRLWQIDLWRKRGLGLLAQSFGADYVAQDRAARLFLYRGDMKAEWAAYGPGAQATAAAFVEGVNAYVAAVRAGRAPLPPEFALTDSAPDFWRPEDVVRIRSHALVSNVLSEVTRAQVACVAGLETDRLRWPIEPAHRLVVPAGLDVCAIPKDVLGTYLQGVSPVVFRPPTKLAHAGLEQQDTLEAPGSEGSNAWVVAPQRSATGRAILANDPHRALGAPSLRYVAHLEAPGLSVIGAGEPAQPGLSLGHNRQIAWGITIFNADQEDLYVYDLKADDPAAYRHRGGWTRIRTIRETIAVKGEAAREVNLEFTDEGPILARDPAHHRAFALRTVWSEPGSSGYFASIGLLRARTWRDFLAVRDRWGVPPLNLLYADVSGNIGWTAAGFVPKRGSWDGLLPAPGDGRFQWDGLVAGAALPSLYNPKAGWFASANEMNLPKDYPAEDHPIAFEWGNRARVDRINQVLAQADHADIKAMAALQADTHNLFAARASALLAGLSSPNPRTAMALDLLKRWDHDETASSPASAIYEVWTSRYLPQALLRQLAPPAVQPLIGSPSLAVVLSYLEHPDARLGPDPIPARNTLMLATLELALTDLEAQLGPDPASWSWGRLHVARFDPAITAVTPAGDRARFSSGPAPQPGSGDTPRAETYRSSDFHVVAGASVRMVLDVGAWDRSVVINAPGQSGDPASPHYRDLFPLWAAGDDVPLVYSRDAVLRATERVLSLVPARKAHRGRTVRDAKAATEHGQSAATK